jgi:hypothetical protein
LILFCQLHQFLLPDSFGCFSLVADAGSCLDKSMLIMLQIHAWTLVISTLALVVLEQKCVLTYPYSHENSDSIDWLISIPGMPDLHFENEDSIYINIPVAGSYSATVTIEDPDDAYTCIGFIDVVEGPEFHYVAINLSATTVVLL